MFNNRVLVIDDEIDILDIFLAVLGTDQCPDTSQVSALQRLLDSTRHNATQEKPPRSFRVDTAAQGETGVAMVRRAVEENMPYAVIFVDMRMPPGWNGIRTIQEIHRLDPNAQVVIVTAYSDAPINTIVEQVGFTNRLLYLKKPFDDEEILQLADSLCMRWNLEQKVRNFLSILEELFNSLAEFDLTCGEEALQPVLKRILAQLAEFLDTRDVFLAKVVNEEIHFRIGLGKFSNGITLQPSFLEIIKKVLKAEKVEEIFRLNQYVVMPIILRSCRNVVVGVLNDRQVEGTDRLLEILALNTAKILDQNTRITSLCREVELLREREKHLLSKLKENS